MTNVQRHRTLMQTQVSLPRKILFSVVIMLLLLLIVYGFDVPNPNMVLIAGLVLCSSVFGYGGGITAGIIMLIYTLYFFSTDNDFIHFTTQNLQKVFVSLFGILADMLLVCSLKKAEVAAFNEVQSLTSQLTQENGHLKEISLIDGLTGIRNRMALREDYVKYRDQEVTVMMADLDNFKAINDHLGHEEGDRVLRAVAALLASAFGVEHCYRYGGDEFLVICPDLSENEFLKKVDEVQNALPSMLHDGEEKTVGLSMGYVHRRLGADHTLRELFTLADEEMYHSKKAKGDSGARR